MRWPRIQAAVVLITTLLSLILAQQDTPQIVKAIPVDGANDVRPGLSAIRIEFDRDMDTQSGFSVMRDPQRKFPTVEEQPHWESPRVFVMTVRLDPDTEYGFAINSADPKYQRFKSQDGTAAPPTAFAFTTTSNRPLRGAELTAANRKSVDRLRKAIDRDYSYRDLRKVNWPESFDEYQERLENAESPREFAELAAELLKRAGDVHIWLDSDGKRIATTPWAAGGNFHSQGIRRTIPNLRQLAPSVAVGDVDNVHYVVLGTFLAERKDDIEIAARHIATLNENTELILDVRPNGGGNELLARQIAGLFLSETKAYARNRSRDPSAADGFGPIYDRKVGPRADDLKFPGERVVLLIGPRNGSSCQAFILMMKQVPNCQLVGERTMGASGNPQPVTLANGVTVWLPSWQAMFPDGTLLEGRGIDPDATVPSKGVDFSQSDPVLKRAIELLKKG